MKMSLYQILDVLISFKCSDCPNFNVKIKEDRIKECISHIKDNLIQEVTPPLMNCSFKKDAKPEIISNAGGHNNCRALSIRGIREFCSVKKEEPYKDDLIIID